MDIRLNQVGLIVSGDSAGQYIKVIEDDYSNGAYYILTTSGDSNFPIFDGWVEARLSLEKYFQESKWVIKWLEGSFPDPFL